jgi:pseudouridine-5'-phosphate glycosidase
MAQQKTAMLISKNRKTATTMQTTIIVSRATGWSYINKQQV